jgi:phosphatidylglycerophosphate synthase
VLFIIKEGFMLVMGCRLLSQGKMLKGALFTGKLCTTVIFLSMIILVIFRSLPRPAVISVVALCSVFMLISLVSYARCYLGHGSHITDIENTLKEQ